MGPKQSITFSTMSLFMGFVQQAALMGIAYHAEETADGFIKVTVTGA